jgi:transcriptional regulator with XRE-family HTH domain
VTRRIPIDPEAPVRSLRDALGLSQGAMAEALGLADRSGVAQLERRGRAVGLERLGEIARALGYDVELVAHKRQKPRQPVGASGD